MNTTEKYQYMKEKYDLPTVATRGIPMRLEAERKRRGAREDSEYEELNETVNEGKAKRRHRSVEH